MVFFNERGKAVELNWMDRNGTPRPYGGIAAGKQKRQLTRPGAVWQIRKEGGTPLGYFIVEDRSAQAVIPGSTQDSINP